MNKTRKEMAAASIEISLIFILTAALIIMFAAYCNIRNASRYSELPEMDFRNESAISGETVPAETLLGILNPDFIGIIGDNHTAPADISVRNQLLEDIRPFLLSAFSDISTILEFSSEQSKNDYIEDNLYSEKNGIYISFSREIPASAIIPAINGNANTGSSHAFNVKDLFIFCDSDGAVSGATIDSKGNVATLTVRDRTTLSFEKLRLYEESNGMKKFEFAISNGKKYPVMVSSVTRNSLASYTNTGDFLSAGSSDAQRTLSAFGFNPNGTRYYSTADSSIIYVEDSAELKISADGNVTYTAIGNEALLPGVTDKTEYSFADKISSAYSVISHLEREHFGNMAHLALTEVCFNENKRELTLHFSYSCNGVYIENDGGKPAAEFIFGENRLLSASVCARSFSLMENTYTDIPQKLLFAFSAQEFTANASPIAFSPIYKMNSEGLYDAKYAFIYSNSDVLNENGR